MRRTLSSLLLAFLVLSSLLAIAAPGVIAAASDFSNFGADGTNSDWGVFEPLSLVIKPIIHLFTVIGDLDQDTMAAVTRFVIWLVVFALVYGGLGAAGQAWLSNNIRMVLGFAFATISAIFMPEDWIMQIGSGWAQVAFIAMTIPILLVVLVFAIKTWNSQPILSMACWFLLSGLLLYYKAAMGIAKPDNNVMGGWTGIIAIVVQYALVIVLIALIISVFKAMGSLTAGGGAQLFGGGLGGLTNWFRPNPGGPGPGPGPGPIPPVPPIPPPGQNPLQQQIAGLVQQITQQQGAINALNAQLQNPANNLTQQQVTDLMNAINVMIQLQGEYNNLMAQLNAQQHP